MPPLVDVSELRVVARDQEGREMVIVKRASFSVARGEVVALIGESGSGKTTIALSLMGYARPGCRIAGGSVRIGDSDVLSLSPRQLADLRGRRVAYISQSAAAAFNPAKSIMAQVIEGARIHDLEWANDGGQAGKSREAKGRQVHLLRGLAHVAGEAGQQISQRFQPRRACRLRTIAGNQQPQIVAQAALNGIKQTKLQYTRRGLFRTAAAQVRIL